MSAANYINFFIDANAREPVDGFFTVNYPDFADPAGALLHLRACPTASQNYDGFSDPKITELMDAARTTADDTKRAQLVVAPSADHEELPWIPGSAPDTILVMNKAITGPPVTFSVHVRSLGCCPAGGERLSMARFLLRRFLMLIAALLVSSFVIFSALYVAPGNPAGNALRRPHAAAGGDRGAGAPLPPRPAVLRSLLRVHQGRAAR